MPDPERMEYELEPPRPGLPWRWIVLIALIVWGGAWWLA